MDIYNLINTIIPNSLNGNPIHDAVICGVIFSIFMIFYQVFFSAVFSFFKK